jgi:hypothetical protein
LKERVEEEEIQEENPFLQVELLTHVKSVETQGEKDWLENNCLSLSEILLLDQQQIS